MIPFRYRRGVPIAEKGLYSHVLLSDYHSAFLCDGPSISSSGLRTIFNESPAHYWCRSPYNPDRAPPHDTEAFTLGRAAHHLLLGEDDFSTQFIARPTELGGEAWQGNRKACKAWMAEQAIAGRAVLTPKQIEQIRGMARSLAAHPLVKNGVLNGRIEQSMIWRCKDTGIWKKSRPDTIPGDGGDFVDLKTTTSVQTDALMRTIAEYGYAQQGALVCEGFHALTGSNDSTFTLGFVEKEPPYCVRFVSLTDQDLARGERANFAAIQTFATCSKSGEWPGPGAADAEYLPMAEWMQKRMDLHFERMDKEAA